MKGLGPKADDLKTTDHPRLSEYLKVFSLWCKPVSVFGRRVKIGLFVRGNSAEGPFALVNFVE